MQAMKNSVVLFFLSAGLLGGLAGCSGSILPESKKIEYKSAGKLPPLEIPPDLTQQSRDERYTVPDVAASKGSCDLLGLFGGTWRAGAYQHGAGSASSG
jgi:uncharacterized lipoprotein